MKKDERRCLTGHKNNTATVFMDLNIFSSAFQRACLIVRLFLFCYYEVDRLKT